MATRTDPRIDALAEECVQDMGDIFWDFNAERDALGLYADPRQLALQAVKKAMSKLASIVDTCTDFPASPRDEYDTLIARLGETAADDQIVDSLVRDADWTEQGARVVLQLAHMYGTSILRSALALAAAMGIEDGDAGL